MDDAAIQCFFTEPTHTYHRQYEALRAVFVDGRKQKEVAEQFGYTYGSFRQLVHHFRSNMARTNDDNTNDDNNDNHSPFFET